MSVGECGIAAIEVTGLRIIDGEDASPGEFPYQVLVLTVIGDRRLVCGGAIIKKQWVVTAAHCFFGNEDTQTSSFTVKGGSIYENETYELLSDRVFVHEKFKATSKGYDIALIHLSDEIDFNSTRKLRPVCLGEESDIPYGGKAVATGWGETRDEEGRPNTLQVVPLDVITMEECSSMLVPQLPKDTNMVMCAITPNKDTCRGDSGGPLVAQRTDGHWALVGITSYGLGCALHDSPGIYTRLDYYLPWIKEQIRA